MKLGDFCNTKLICYRNNSNQRPSDPRVLWFLSLNCLSPRTLSTLCWAETLSILSPEAISLQALFKGQRSQCFLCPKFHLPHFTQTHMDNSSATRLLIPLHELCWNIMITTYICTALYNLKFSNVWCHFNTVKQVLLAPFYIWERLHNIPAVTGLKFRCSGSKSNVLLLSLIPAQAPNTLPTVDVVPAMCITLPPLAPILWPPH